jgi:hypothetical protein
VDEGVELVDELGDGVEGSGVMQNLLTPYSVNPGFGERSNSNELILGD